MTTNIPSDVTVIDELLAINLDIRLWSACRKLKPEDLGGATLPPEELASLGSKRVADPAALRIFAALKARAFALMERHGVRFMSGWAIPEGKAGMIVEDLVKIRDEFLQEKTKYLADYDKTLAAWIDKHKEWESLISNSTVSSAYVGSRMDFRWQVFKVSPLITHDNNTVVMESGLAEEVTGLGNTLFGEVAGAAKEMWRRVYADRAEVTHKALSPLRTLRDKLFGLSFVEPHVAPVAEIIDAAMNRLPKRGNISGTDLLMLQGLVCVLTDTDSLIEHAQAILNGVGAPNMILDRILARSLTGDEAESNVIQTESKEVPALPEEPVAADSESQFVPQMVPPVAHPNITSLGLW